MPIISAMPANTLFILFQGRILNTAHMVSLVPPRPDGGKQIIEARMVGNVSFFEEYGDDETAAGRYLDLAATLLGDHSIADGVHRDDAITLSEIRPIHPS